MSSTKSRCPFGIVMVVNGRNTRAFFSSIRPTGIGFPKVPVSRNSGIIYRHLGSSRPLGLAIRVPLRPRGLAPWTRPSEGPPPCTLSGIGRCGERYGASTLRLGHWRAVSLRFRPIIRTAKATRNAVKTAESAPWFNPNPMSSARANATTAPTHVGQGGRKEDAGAEIRHHLVTHAGSIGWRVSDPACNAHAIGCNTSWTWSKARTHPVPPVPTSGPPVRTTPQMGIRALLADRVHHGL